MARNISTDISIRWLLNRVFLLSKACHECTHSWWFFIILYCNYIVNVLCTILFFWISCDFFSCGSERDRTDDLLNANQALSQLSYGPMFCTDTLHYDCSRAIVWARVDLNHRPHAYQACALTSWATGPWFYLIYQFYDNHRTLKTEDRSSTSIPSSIADISCEML